MRAEAAFWYVSGTGAVSLCCAVEGKVPDYRVYGVNKDGQLAEATQISAVSDDEAKLIAHKMLDGADVEIWEGARLVARLPHEGSEAPGALTYA